MRRDGPRLNWDEAISSHSAVCVLSNVGHLAKGSLSDAALRKGLVRRQSIWAVRPSLVEGKFADSEDDSLRPSPTTPHAIAAHSVLK